MNHSDLDAWAGHMPRGRAQEGDLAALAVFVGGALPADYLGLVADHDGAEAWCGRDYLALWPVDEIIANNQTLEVPRYVPGIVLFATDGGGEAYAYDVGRDWGVVRVPLVGMSPGTIEGVAPSVTEMLRTMTNGVDRPMPARQGDIPSRHNVFDITPVILGGSPIDPTNKAIVPLQSVLELANWWNERIEQLRR